MVRILQEADIVTGVPISFGDFAPLFEGVTSVIFQFLPLILGIVVITIGARVVPYLLSKVMHG